MMRRASGEGWRQRVACTGNGQALCSLGPYPSCVLSCLNRPPRAPEAACIELDGSNYQISHPRNDIIHVPPARPAARIPAVQQ